MATCVDGMEVGMSNDCEIFNFVANSLLALLQTITSAFIFRDLE